MFFFVFLLLSWMLKNVCYPPSICHILILLNTYVLIVNLLLQFIMYHLPLLKVV